MKYILNYFSQDQDYRVRLVSCNLLPLSYRRVYLDLSFLWSMLLEDNCLDFLTHFQFILPSRTWKDLTLNPNFKSHNYYENYFFNRISYIWNAILYEAWETSVNLDSKSQFKPVIKEYIFQTLHDLNSDIKCTWFVPCTCTICLLWK